MADNRTGLSAADIAAQFRDVCGDGSMEWVYTPMQTWLLLDAADMLDENARLRSCLSDAAENARLIMGENAKLRDEFRKMDEWHSKELLAAIDENKKLRELVRHLRECTKHNTCALCDYAEDTCDFDYDMRELGVVE